MPNSIALAQKYLPILDELYKRESLTSYLDTANSDLDWTGADTVRVFKMTLDGLANYGRNTGFVAGSETATWETYKVNIDRGISISVDALDDEQTLAQAFGRLAGEYVRVHEVPEIDALNRRAA